MVVYIKVKPHPGNEAGIVGIEESDYDPKIHTKVEDVAKVEAPPVTVMTAKKK